MAEPRVFNDLGAGLEEAERALAAGRLVVFPTDTVFGLAAHPEVEGGTRAIFAAKGRSRELTLPVLVSSVEDARLVGALDRRAERLASAYWPGALTLVVPRKEAARAWDLGEQRETVGIRVPHHPVALALLRRTGPLAVTSANISGEPTPSDWRDVRATLADAVAVYVVAEPRPAGLASTVVDLTGTGGVLREGEVPAAEVLAVLSGEAEAEGGRS